MNRDIKFKQGEPVPRVEFTPQTKEEKLHLLRIRELLCKTEAGDWGTVGEIIGTNDKEAKAAVLNVNSPKHFEALFALEEIIESEIEYAGPLSSKQKEQFLIPSKNKGKRSSVRQFIRRVLKKHLYRIIVEVVIEEKAKRDEYNKNDPFFKSHGFPT
jgi:hypothetical protein